MLIDVVSARRHPYQVFLGALCVVAGMPTLFGGPKPGTLAHLMPEWMLYLWAATIVVGGAGVVAAAITRNTLTALYVEGISQLPLCVVATLYAVTIAWVVGYHGLPAAAIVFGFAVAAGVRFYQIATTLRRVSWTLHQGTDDDQ